MAVEETENHGNDVEPEQQVIDSKYRLIILAAQRSKQIQRGARPRVNIDPLKHKSTRIALEEVNLGQVRFTIQEKDPKPKGQTSGGEG